MQRVISRGVFAVIVALGLFGMQSVRAEDAAAPSDPELERYQKFIQQMAGNWTATVTFMGNADPSFAIKGEETNVIGAGGNWLISDFNGERYHGHGIFGYDQALKSFTSAWVDSMKPGIASSRGTLNDSGNLLTMSSGPEAKFKGRITFEIKDKDTRVSSFYGTGADGKEFQMMTIVYKRKS